MAPTGGYRKRIIRESLYQMLYSSLEDLGWFDSGRQHSAITFNSEAVDPAETVPLNTISLADENDLPAEVELGSTLTRYTWTFYVDFFAEKDSLGLHVAADIQDILLGNYASIGRVDPSFTVYDYGLATPSELFVCQIETVMRDKAVAWSLPHQKHWYNIRFDVVDYYGSEGE